MARLWLVGWFLVAAAALPAQHREFPPDIFDTRPVALDPAHFQMVFENDQVQVIRVHLGPHEKSAVLELPSHVMICLTDQRVRLAYGHGKPAERSEKAGFSGWVERSEYSLENLEDKPADWIVVAPADTDT